MSIDPECIELTADVLRITLYSRLWPHKLESMLAMKMDHTIRVFRVRFLVSGFSHIAMGFKSNYASLRWIPHNIRSPFDVKLRKFPQRLAEYASKRKIEQFPEPKQNTELELLPPFFRGNPVHGQ